MKSFLTFLLVGAVGASLSLWSQTPPPQPPKPSAPPAATRTLDGGVTVPVQIAQQSMTTVPKDKVVIQVNDIKITAGQLDQILEAYPENTRVFVRGPGRQQFIDSIVRTLVLCQEGKRRKLDEDPAYKVQSEFSLEGILASHTNEDIKKKIQVDDAARMKYYEDHKNEYVKVRARHILIRAAGAPVPVRPGQKDLSDADALAKAKDLRAKIQAGADFAELAKTESDDTGSGANGGELGFFGHGQMVPTFEETAFKLNPGDLSEPVRSPFGYHLIQTEEKQTKTFDEVKAEIEPKLAPDLAKKQVDELVNKANVILDPEFLPASKVSK